MDVLLKVAVILVLDMIHPFSIQLLDTLPDLPMILVMVGVLVLGTPVAKIGGENKQGVLVVEVGSKYLAILSGHFFVHWPSQYGHYLCFTPDSLVDERKLHFNAVLVLIVVNIQHEEAFLILELIDDLCVDLQRAKRGAILVHIGEGASWEVLMMRGTEDEDSLDTMRSSHILIGPGCCWSTEVEPCVGSDQCLDYFRFFVFLGSVDVLSKFGIQFSG